MAPNPFARRKATKAMRYLAMAKLALSLLPPARRAAKRVPAKPLLIGGAAAGVGAAAYFGRHKAAALLPSRGRDEAAPAPTAPPQPSNYDAPGPPANTATPIPAPDPQGEPPAKVDPAAEEAAAAAEAGAIGGEPSDYSGPAPDEPAGESFRPLAEAGEGESEGAEQAEADLAENATDPDLATPVDETAPDVPGGGISGRPRAGLTDDATETETETPGVPATGGTGPEEGTAAPAADTPATPPTKDDDDGAEYRTWSGDAVKP